MAEDKQEFTVRLDRDRYDLLRREAYERHVSLSAIVNESIAEHLDRRAAERAGGR